METKTIIINILIIWLIINVFALLLMQFRSDFSKYQKEADFIISKSTLAHKLTYILICWFVLPFSIFKSIKNIFNPPKNK